MNKLKELIQKLCSNGVEYKTIKETVGLNRGKRLTKSELLEESNTEFKYAVYHGSKDTPLGFYNNFNAPKGTTIVVNTGGIGGVKYIGENFWCSDGSFWLGKTNNINEKYLYYCLSGYEDYFSSKKRIGGVPTIDKSIVENFSIPVPPLEVQEEIVRILDKFTTLEAELEAELTARKKQYEYYRRKLLTFSEDIPVFSIKEIGTVSIGEFVHKSKQNPNAQYPVFNGGISNTGFYNDFNRTANKVIISARGANAGFVNRVFTNFWSGNSCYTIDIPNGKVDWNYAYFWMKSNETKLLGDQQKGGIPAISKKQVEEFQIPVPPIEEQRRIVSILDKFDMLATSISEGLPKEIELRRKQYEYYRNQLLSFPDNKATD